MEIAVPTLPPPESSEPDGISIESARNLTIIYSLLIGLASVLAIIAGKDNWALLLIPIAIVVSVGVFILRSPFFETRRWLPTLLLPIAVWLVTVFMD